MNFKHIKGIEFDTSIMVLGDLHATWQKPNQLIAKHKPSIILQVGDFGWWPKFHKTSHINHGTYRRDPMTGIKVPSKFNQYGLRLRETKCYFCPGNHEDWEDLNLLATSENPTPIEVSENLFYMPRCSTLDLPDGRRVLFMGGAHSIDRDSRKLGYDWFPQETITHGDIHNLPDTNIDIVVSHTCANYFKTELLDKTNDWRQTDSYWLGKFRDPSCMALDAVWEQYRPKLWFFGHYHIAKFGDYRGTKWFALNKEASTGWWMYMPK